MHWEIPEPVTVSSNSNYFLIPIEMLYYVYLLNIL